LSTIKVKVNLYQA